MIKRVRFHFVVTTMAIIFVVFWAVLTATYFTMRSEHKKEVDFIFDKMTASASEQVIHTPLKGIIIKDDGEGNFINVYDENIFTAEQTLELYKYSLNTKFKSGNSSAVFYKLTENGSNRLFLAVNRSEELSLLTQTYVKLIIIFAAAFILLLAVVILLSFWIVKPIKESLVKQSQFISDAGHELKTPISIISASAEALKEDIGDNEYLNTINSQTKKMGKLISDLLSLSKLQERKGKKVISDINLSEVITQAILPFDALAYEKKNVIETVIDKNVSVKADEESVKQIVNIFLDNAVKYAEPNTKIICSLDNSNDKPVFAVFNENKSVKKDIEEKIFERFFRSDDSRSRETGGSGLGLSIAKHVAEENGFKVYAEIEEEKSITVCLKF